MNRHRRHCWTLIELLVTIGIIAVLASFLMPALKRSRDAARMIKCRNNQKNIITANFLYMDDYDEIWAQGNNGEGAYCWFSYENSLGSYLDAVRTANDINSAQIVRCPAPRRGIRSRGPAPSRASTWRTATTTTLAQTTGTRPSRSMK